jgi:hypothetical protein
MNPPDIALYVTSNNIDHGPLSLKEATARVQSGEFKPTDLGWHQGVSGWIPLKDLPEWNKMQAPPALPLAKKKAKGTTPEGSPPAMGSSPKKVQLRSGSPGQIPGDQSMDGFAEDRNFVEPQGGGIVSKLLIAFALFIFLAALVILGLYCYNNWDEILLDFQ